MKLCNSCLYALKSCSFDVSEITMGFCERCKDFDIVSTLDTITYFYTSNTIELEHPFIDILRKHVNNPYLENYVIDLEEEEFYWLMHGLTS